MSSRRWLSMLGVVTTMFAGCGGGSIVPDPKLPPMPGPNRCEASIQNPRPFVVDWESVDRGLLEAMIRRGVVAVKRDGCKVEVVQDCRIPTKYDYVPLNPKHDTVHLRDATSLYASVPVGAFGLEAKLEQFGELSVERAIVGRYETARDAFPRAELGATCREATHVVTGLSIGAFRFNAGAATEVGGGIGTPIGDANVDTSKRRETLSEEGDLHRCAATKGTDTEPPFGCGGLVQVELRAIESQAACVPRSEECNGVDDDCNGKIDEGCPKSLAFADAPATGLYGGNGGAEFSRSCPAGQVVRGLYGGHGVYVYELGVICGTPVLDSQGGRYSIAMKDGAALPALGGNVEGPRRSWNFTCPNDGAMTAIGGRSGEFVDAIEVQCSQLGVSGGRQSFAIALQASAKEGPLGGPGGNPFVAGCGAGRVMTGVKGRAGAWMDAIGATCKNVSLSDGSAPAPRPIEIGSGTGLIANGATAACPERQLFIEGRCYAEGLRGAVESARALWVDRSRRRWSGQWTKGREWRFDFELTVTRSGIDLDGVFAWQLITAPTDSFLHKRIGSRGNEFVKGTVDLATGVISLAGQRVDDPSLLGIDVYELRLAPGGFLSGSTKTGEGTWGAVLVARPL